MFLLLLTASCGDFSAASGKAWTRMILANYKQTTAQLLSTAC